MTKRRAEVEETRRRILDATMGLHASQGILATSWEDIAKRANVAVGTVYRHFASLDELVPACGAVSMERLAPPSVARRRELFEDVDDPPERIRRLVAECYAMYERAADVIVAVRRERDCTALPMVAAAFEEIEAAIDALVKDAVSPLQAGRRERRIARAICDHDFWAALRRQGLEPGEACEAACALLETGLARRSGRG